MTAPEGPPTDFHRPLDRLTAANARAGEVHLRPEVIYAHETHRKFSRVHPGRLQDGVVTYQVVPVDDATPPPKELESGFITEHTQARLGFVQI